MRNLESEFKCFIQHENLSIKSKELGDSQRKNLDAHPYGRDAEAVAENPTDACRASIKPAQAARSSRIYHYEKKAREATHRVSKVHHDRPGLSTCEEPQSGLAKASRKKPTAAREDRPVGAQTRLSMLRGSPRGSILTGAASKMNTQRASNRYSHFRSPEAPQKEDRAQMKRIPANLVAMRKQSSP